VLRLAELWSSHLGPIDRREWGALHTRLRERVAADQLPDLLVTLEHPRRVGRLLGSAIMRVDDAAGHARRVEEAVAGALAGLGVRPHPRVQRPVISVQGRRIGMLGGRDWFAIDVNGPARAGTTSVQRETDGHVSLEDVRRALAASFSRAHARHGVEVAPEWLGRPAR
jgi:hypothetical protein